MTIKQLLNIPFLSLCFMLLTLAACDAHRDFPDTTMKPCHILCTDGRVVSYNEYMSQKKTAIGVVFYVNQSGSTEHEGTGYAVYLWDSQTPSEPSRTPPLTSASMTVIPTPLPSSIPTPWVPH